MKDFLKARSLVLVVATTVSCGTKKIATQNIEMPPLTISAASPINKYRETRPRYWDITHTDAAISFNLKEKTADGVATIKLHPYAYSQDILVLDAKAMDIHSVKQAGLSKPLSYKQQSDSLIISFGKTFSVKDSIDLVINYTAKPYSAASGGSSAISDDRGLYFINTDGLVSNKPVQIWTQGETESNSHWLPTIDQPNERFTFSLAITVADSFTTLSNGEMISSKRISNGLRTDTWRMDKPIQTYAMMMAIGKFDVSKDKSWKGKEVSYYTEPQFAPYAKTMFQHTPEMVDFFSRVTGVDYPWNKYSQVVVRDYVSGAMENTTASLFGEFMNQNFREMKDKNNEGTVAHELFHQWFGDYVTAESWSNLTLNESFATYGEQLWRNYKYGVDSRDELAWGDVEKYIASTRNDDPPLVRFYYDNKEDMFDRVSYQKGASILRYMHGLMGDTAFSKAMKIYLIKNALQPAEATDWRKAVEEATGQDWTPFFNQWYMRGGHPTLEVKYDYDDAAKKLTVTTIQKGGDSSFAYTLPLKGLLITGDEKEEVDWQVSKKTSKQVYSYLGSTRPVFVPDSRHWLVGTIDDKKTPVQWLTQQTEAGDYISKVIALNALAAGNNDTSLRAGIQLSMKDRQAAIRLAGLRILLKKNGNAWVLPFKQDVIMTAMNDGNNEVRATAFEVLGKWKISESKDEMLKALTDSSYFVAGAALRGLNRMDSLEALGHARQLSLTHPKNKLHEAVWDILAGQGDPADAKAFVTEAPLLYGTRKTAFAGNLKRYAQQTKDDAAFETAARTIATMAMQENIKPYRLTIGAYLWQLHSFYKSKGNKFDNRMNILQSLQNEVIAAEPDKDIKKQYAESGG